MGAYQDNKVDGICFEFRETGKCARGDKCFAQHADRTGDACTDSEYIKTGVCSEYTNCKSVHIWDTSKHGAKEAFLNKEKNFKLKAAVKYFPAMMMRKASDSDSSGYDEEPPMEIGKHVSL